MSRTSRRDRPIALSTREHRSGSMRAFATNPMRSKLAQQGKLGTLGSGIPNRMAPVLR